MAITKSTLIGEMLQYDIGIASVLMQAGMHCVGCPASQMESLAEACAVHGIDGDEIVDALNDYLLEHNA